MMAIGWLTILKTVPWTEVIRNAPKIADGAKKLWKTAGGKRPAPVRASVSGQPAEALSAAALAARVADLEALIAELHEQMAASSEVVKALAEQNEQLIRRVEANRRRVAWLTAAIVVLVLTLLAGWLGR